MNSMFQQKLSELERIRIIEQSIFDLHQVKLRVHVQLVESEYVADDETLSDIDEDPLIAEARELGAEINIEDE